jgi:hypothetical protein
VDGLVAPVPSLWLLFLYIIFFLSFNLFDHLYTSLPPLLVYDTTIRVMLLRLERSSDDNYFFWVHYAIHTFPILTFFHPLLDTAYLLRFSTPTTAFVDYCNH